jgi:thioredoxin reductase/ferredoxin
LDAEIRRVVDLGVELRLRTALGRDVSAGELRDRHRALFIGIGAGRGVRLNIPGERGDGVWLGVDYLSAVNHGEAVVLGSRVVVIGGGNTAVDAARVARRRGASVTILYRRTSAEMPANAGEIEAARSEGVIFQGLALPVRIERSGGIVTGIVAQRTQLADTDASGRRRAVPLAGTEFVLPADAVIVAVSQATNWSGVEGFDLPDRVDTSRVVDSRGIRVVAGGDVLKPGIAASAIAEGRRAAEAVHAKLRGLPQARHDVAPVPSAGLVVKTESYPPGQRTCVPSVSVAERMLHADSEVERTLSEEAFLGEVTRCFSCGLCFGCEQCYMHCNAAAFSRTETTAPGAYFSLRLERCEGCAKCIELCPCGFLSMASYSALGVSGGC